MNRRSLAPALIMATVVALLAACTDQARIPPAEPSLSEAPLFASDEEALAAATAAYEEYLRVSSEAASTFPFDLDELSTLTTADYLLEETEVLSYFEREGLVVSGHSSLVGSSLQQSLFDQVHGAVVVIYVCVDVGGSRLIDYLGNDKTPADRLDLIGLEIEFIEGDKGQLLLNRSEQWASSSTC